MAILSVYFLCAFDLRFLGDFYETVVHVAQLVLLSLSRSLRGFPSNRFAGDASLLGSAEARLRLFNTFILVPGSIGVFGVADVGRVYLEDDSSGDDVDMWHSDFGGGLYYGVLKRTFVVAAGVATGKEGTRFYFGLGMGR